MLPSNVVLDGSWSRGKGTIGA